MSGSRSLAGASRDERSHRRCWRRHCVFHDFPVICPPRHGVIASAREHGERATGTLEKRQNAEIAGLAGFARHVADAPEVARQTGAKLYGGPPTTEWLKAQGVPDAQLVTWKGGETQRFNGFSIQAVHAAHAPHH